MCFVLIYILGKNLTRVRRILLLQAGPDIRTTPRESNHAMCITQPRRITSGHSHKHNPIDPDQPSPIIRACGHSNYNPQSNVLWSAAHSTAVHMSSPPSCSCSYSHGSRASRRHDDYATPNTKRSRVCRRCSPSVRRYVCLSVAVFRRRLSPSSSSSSVVVVVVVVAVVVVVWWWWLCAHWLSELSGRVTEAVAAFEGKQHWVRARARERTKRVHSHLLSQ